MPSRSERTAVLVLDIDQIRETAQGEITLASEEAQSGSLLDTAIRFMANNNQQQVFPDEGIIDPFTAAQQGAKLLEGVLQVVDPDDDNSSLHDIRETLQSFHADRFPSEYSGDHGISLSLGGLKRNNFSVSGNPQEIHAKSLALQAIIAQASSLDTLLDNMQRRMDQEYHPDGIIPMTLEPWYYLKRASALHISDRSAYKNSVLDARQQLEMLYDGTSVSMPQLMERILTIPDHDVQYPLMRDAAALAIFNGVDPKPFILRVANNVTQGQDDAAKTRYHNMILNEARVSYTALATEEVNRRHRRR